VHRPPQPSADGAPTAPSGLGSNLGTVADYRLRYPEVVADLWLENQKVRFPAVLPTPA